VAMEIPVAKVQVAVVMMAMVVMVMAVANPGRVPVRVIAIRGVVTRPRSAGVPLPAAISPAIVAPLVVPDAFSVVEMIKRVSVLIVPMARFRRGGCKTQREHRQCQSGQTQHNDLSFPGQRDELMAQKLPHLSTKNPSGSLVPERLATPRHLKCANYVPSANHLVCGCCAICFVEF
jgi:hypothetical protein